MPTFNLEVLSVIEPVRKDLNHSSLSVSLKATSTKFQFTGSQDAQKCHSVEVSSLLPKS